MSTVTAFPPEALPGLFDQARDLILVMTPAGRIQYANGRWEAVLGRDVSTQVGIAASELIDPRWHQQWQEQLGKVSQSHQGAEVALTLAGAGASRPRIAGNLHPVMQGETVVAICGIWRDVTRQSRREQQMQAQYVAADALSNAETIADATALILGRLCETFGWREGAFWTIDPETKALRCSDCWVDPAAEMHPFAAVTRGLSFPFGMGLIGRIWQRPEPVWLPNVLGEPNFWRADVAADAGLTSAFCFPVVDRGQVLGIFEFFSSASEAPDDDLLAVLSTIGRQIGRFCQRLQTEAELGKALVDAQTAIRTKSTFLTNMSHELRSPLNAIIGFSKVLADQLAGPLTDKQSHYAQTIHRNGTYLLALIDSILDFSKTDAGQTTLRPVPLPLRDVIEEVISSLMLQAETKRIALSHSISEALPLVMADPVRLRQICINLLINAITFTPEGGKVSIKVTDKGGKVEVALTDTGIGIAPEDQERIFQPFVQIDNSLSRQHRGTGLGLPLTRHLVELHGGRLMLRSRIGEGSTFCFDLPLAPPLSDLT